MNYVNPVRLGIAIIVSLPLCILVVIVFTTAHLFRDTDDGGV